MISQFSVSKARVTISQVWYLILINIIFQFLCLNNESKDANFIVLTKILLAIENCTMKWLIDSPFYIFYAPHY